MLYHETAFFNHDRVAILIVLEQGWKANPFFRKAGSTRRNPHCTGAGLEDSNRHLRAIARRVVAILIVLEQGWKLGKSLFR